MRLAVLCLLLCGPAWCQTFIQTCAHPAFPDSKAKPIDSACLAEGNGGNDANQNTAKNNFCAKGTAEKMTFPMLNQLQTNVKNDGSILFGDLFAPHPGPQVGRTKLQHMGEGKQVVLKGFIFTARQEGPESVNCKGTIQEKVQNHDIHISIVENASETNECNSVVVEMVPHHRPADWKVGNVLSLTTAPAPLVRITGQLMFDSSHLPCQNGAGIRKNPKRSSLWEVHPIYKLEVCTAQCNAMGVWQDFSEWLKK
jgi:hypothetical protein